MRRTLARSTGRAKRATPTIRWLLSPRKRRRDAPIHGQPAMTALSLLELARVTQGTDEATALHNARDLAAHAERWAYQRVWVAEHHDMAGIASAATAIDIAHIPARTQTMQQRDAGIILPY